MNVAMLFLKTWLSCNLVVIVCLNMVDFCGNILSWFGDAWQISRKDFPKKVASCAESASGSEALALMSSREL